MADETMHVGVLSLELFMASPNSLKAKRSILKSLIDRIRSKFNVSVAEVGDLDKWQKSVCGISIVGNDKIFLDTVLQKIVSFIKGPNILLTGNLLISPKTVE